MNPRLAKEIRPLMLPWLVAALAGGMMPVLRVMDRTTLPWASPFMAASFVFFGCVLLLAAMTFGVEFQQRTFQMLLSQPCERSRVWKEKVAVLGFALGFLALIQLVLQQIVIVGLPDVAALYLVDGSELPLRTWFFPPEKNLLAGVFLLATVCSAGFWTLVARSTIGGMAFTFSAMYCAAVVVALVLGRLFALNVRFHDWPYVLGLAAAGAVYSGVLLWLGWRKFAEMEIRDVTASKSLALPEWMTFRKLAMLLRCQPTGNLRNLLRKEVCLQEPILTIAAVFVLCWFVTLGLFALQPARADLWNGILNGLTVVHVTVVVLLAGCVSLGDDKALGTAAWHLSLPVSARRQWFIKLLVAGATAVAMAVVLPTLLAVLTLFQARVGLLALRPHDAMGYVIPCAIVFVLSFWSGSIVANTVRAALTMVLTAAALATVVFFGVWSAEKLGGLQTGLLTSLIARNQWSPYSLGEVIPIGRILFCLLGVAMLLALVQSFRQFRRAQSEGTAFLRYGAILALVAFAIAFWTSDLNVSVQKQRNQRGSFAIVPEVTDAARAVTLLDLELPEGHVQKLLPEELENPNPLSNRAKLWLRTSIIYVRWTEAKSKHFANLRVYTGEIHLPKGAIVPFGWTVPDLPQAQPPKEKP
ncbi:MAG: hypothetical protein IH623_22095 [Verrucomicrobia bacterium]|nr:hypothetical protein [Verrucomicrobiota bacterium]